MPLKADHGARRKRSNALFLLPVLVVLAATTLGASAQAQKPIVLPEVIDFGPIQMLSADGFRPWAPICQMGEPDTSTLVVDYVTGFPDRYFTLLRSTTCPACVAPDSVLLKFAHVVLDFRIQCSTTFRVGIYGTRPSGACTRPDTNVVLCPPRTVTLEPTGEGVFDLSAALTSNCVIAGDAYLMIDFLAHGAPCATNTRPRLVFSSQCPSCDESFNHVFGGGAWFSIDLCDSFERKRPTMYVDGDLCVTPTRKPSWGSLKLLYR